MSHKFDYVHDLIGAIYENLAGDDPWQIALEQARVILGASNMQLHIADRRHKHKDAIFAYGPKVNQEKVGIWEEYQFRNMFHLNLKMGEIISFKLEDMLPEGEPLNELIKADSSWTIVHCFNLVEEVESLLLASRTPDGAAFSSEDGEFLRHLGLHFRRALRIRRDILCNRLISNYQAEGLNKMAVGGILVEETGSMTLLNGAAKDMVTEANGLKFSHDQIQAIDDRENRQLKSMIQEVLAGQSGKRSLRAMTVTRLSGKRGLGLIIKGQKSRSLVTGKPAMNALIFLRDTEAVSDLDAGIMRQLFGFTRAEANLAVGIAKGLRLDELEEILHIRHNTARAHLRSMFTKADVARQSELVHLLANCVAPLGDSRAID